MCFHDNCNCCLPAVGKAKTMLCLNTVCIFHSVFPILLKAVFRNVGCNCFQLLLLVHSFTCTRTKFWKIFMTYSLISAIYDSCIQKVVLWSTLVKASQIILPPMRCWTDMHPFWCLEFDCLTSIQMSKTYVQESQDVHCLCILFFWINWFVMCGSCSIIIVLCSVFTVCTLEYFKVYFGLLCF